LLEVCVVTAIIAAIAALTLPSITGMFGDARLDAASDMVQARLADARSMAMEQGKAFRFGYMPGTGMYQIAPDDSPLWQSSGPQQGAEPIDKDDQLTGELPQDVKFSHEPGAFSNSGGPGTGNGWQVGGIFLPDGTARGGMNPDGTTIDDVTFYYGMAGRGPHGVRVRGLTGTVRLFDPASSDENEP
jgi:type II secretory pathway pseudopilin PulG